MRKIMHSLTRNFNSRWPAPFMINDLHPWFLGGWTDSESVCPPPQVAEEWEEKRRMKRRRLAICCNMSLHSTPSCAFCFVANRRGRESHLFVFLCICTFLYLCAHTHAVSLTVNESPSKWLFTSAFMNAYMRTSTCQPVSLCSLLLSVL